jgi:hypothetical protein
MPIPIIIIVVLIVIITLQSVAFNSTIVRVEDMLGIQPGSLCDDNVRLPRTARILYEIEKLKHGKTKTTL